jgi:pimeloyl-ACP methyl ester carboxylesterase
MTIPATRHHEERFVEAQPGVHLWADATGDPDATPLLLVMGANATGVAWPDALVARLAEHHRVLRYDHRDTGRSTRAFAERPYPITQLAGDALAIIEAFGADRAHVVGMSLGGMLLQLLLLDAPDRLLSATLFSTGALAGDPALPGEDALSGPRADVLAMWEQLGERRTREQEIAFNLEHWRALSGAGAGGHFDPAEFRALEERVRAHTGHDEPIAAHALADQSGLARGRELARVTTPTLVIDAPLDPVFPPPHAEHLARTIPTARRVTIPLMGHALPAAILPDLADAILAHTTTVESVRKEPACSSPGS